MQERQPDPEVARDAGGVDVGLEIPRRQAVLVDPQLSVLARAQCVGEGGIAAVDLRAVPPVRVVGDEGGRSRRVGTRVPPGSLDRQDRKSTRLNSSHGKSAYAV